MTRAFVAMAALAAFCASCGSADDETPRLGPPPTYPVPGCEHVDHHACDIRLAACQERLMELAACLRGSEPLPVPPITTMTTTEFAAYLNQNIAENPPPNPNHYEIALRLLELVQPGALGQQAMVEADLEFVWGIYRFDEKDVIIVDHGVPADEPDPNSVLVHEFVHALQDADVNLLRYFDENSTSYDSYLALASVSEGEARLHQSRFWSSLLGLDPAKVDWTEHLRETAEFAEQAALEAPSPYTASYDLFPYEFGARFVHHAWLESGPAGIDALFASPPTRTVAVMKSETAIVSADWPAPEFSLPEPPAPFELDGEASLGAWGVFLHLSRVSSPAVARPNARELRGDRLRVYVGSGTPAETVAVWQLEYSSETFADALEAAERIHGASVLRQGNRVVLARSTGTSPLDWALVP